MLFGSKEPSKPIPFPYECSTIEFKSYRHSFGGVDFVCVKSSPASSEESVVKGAPKARLLILHGFDEHALIYSRLMDHLAHFGIECFVFEQRGSGQTSVGKLRGVTDEFNTFRDLDHFIEWNLQDKEKATSLFLFGHSMGGGIVLNYGCNGKYKDKISGIICTGPLVTLHPHTAPSAFLTLASPLLAKFLPRFRIDTGLDLEATTSDERYREFLSHDPLTVPLYGSFRQIYDFLERGKRLARDRAHVAQFRAPVLIFHGEDDTINDPIGSQSFYDLCPVSDKRLRLFPQARHALCLETDETFEQLVEELQSWISERVTTV
ncbi:LADA_0G10836g1_1 [Lachancea dasiensis]|uniref:LADA_0G10836g1_1 n=1 Tax=Lachancea dasiensis TaxID=1072105 RepID=A0A1G4JV26_9SACH|nr:LADA_0G10836g1_1 [Lachancea dasiensis]